MDKMWFIYCVMVVSFASPAYLQSCSSQCRCSFTKVGLLNVDCKSMNLSAIPNDIPNNTVSLDLSNNIISKIGDSSFSSLSMLRKLTLDNNEIKTISPMAFNGLSSLESLFMVYCGLSNWPEELLGPTKKLTALYLTNNVFENIPNITSKSLSKLFLDNNKFTSLLFPDSFKQNSNLKSVVLSSNNIPQIVKDDDFLALNDLPIISLKLSNCGLKNISPIALSKLVNLKTLDLNSNGLVTSQLDSVLSKIDKNLESLSINNNQITNLSSNLFNRFEHGKLNVLNVDGNPFSFIDPQAFAPLTQLTHVDLSNSEFRVLPSQALASAVALQDLRITNGKLETIETKAFKMHEISTNKVDFSNNPFKCDCSLAWFITWFNVTKVSILDKDKYLCGSPETLKGKPLVLFSVANCSTVSTTTTSIAPNTSHSTHSSVPLTTTPTSHHSESAMSIISIVLIVIGCVLVLIFIFVIVVLVRHYRNKRRVRIIEESLIENAAGYDEIETFGEDESLSALQPTSNNAYLVENPQLKSFAADDEADSRHEIEYDADALFVCSSQDVVDGGILKNLFKKLDSENEIKYRCFNKLDEELTWIKAKRTYLVLSSHFDTDENVVQVVKKLRKRKFELTLLKLEMDLNNSNLTFRKELSLSHNVQRNYNLIFDDVVSST